jgi:hypothetical protein
MSAPEKIYIDHRDSGHCAAGYLSWRQDATDLEYIRADLHEAAMAALKADHQERVFMVRAELKAATLLMDHALNGSAESCVKNAELRTENALLRELLEGWYNDVSIPDSNCSCHISPPCSDCVNYGGLRETAEETKRILGVK